MGLQTCLHPSRGAPKLDFEMLNFETPLLGKPRSAPGWCTRTGKCSCRIITWEICCVLVVLLLLTETYHILNLLTASIWVDRLNRVHSFTSRKSVFWSQLFCCCRPSSPSTPNATSPQPPEGDMMDSNQDNSLDPHNDPRKFDSTGMFHWCPERPIEDGFIVSFWKT